jgi:hypothetical protein
MTVSAQELDLSLFRLPTHRDPGNAEVGIGRRGTRAEPVKRRFWGTLAKRLDLTGRGSLIERSPYGTGHDRVLEGFERRVEQLHDELNRRAAANVLVSPDLRQQPSKLPRHVESCLEEVTPQFFLRNIPRVERPMTNVRRLESRYVVWREDDRELIEFARRPKREPIEFLAELSSVAMRQLRQEAWERVLGLNWETDVGNFRPAVFRVPSFGQVESGKRIPLAEHQDEPARALRETSGQRHQRTLRELGKRYDASKGEE